MHGEGVCMLATPTASPAMEETTVAGSPLQIQDMKCEGEVPVSLYSSLTNSLSLSHRQTLHFPVLPTIRSVGQLVTPSLSDMCCWCR